MIRVVQASGEQHHALSPLDGRFVGDSRLELRLNDGRLSGTVVPAPPREKAYPATQVEGDGAASAVTFIAFADDRHVGRIDLSKHWNGFAFIHSLVVDQALRRSGVAMALMRHAMAWSDA